jgi:predicted negative regulator of RcsB-dependent stress response
MKKEELKKDPIAEKLVAAVEFSKNNSSTMFLGLTIIISIFVGISYYQNSNEEYQLESKIAVDEVMLQLINDGLNDPDYFNEKLSQQIDSIYDNYPNSKYVNYLAFIVNKQGSDTTKALMIDLINDVKYKIENKWFKTQASLVSGDYYADNNQLDLAKKEYKNAIKYSSSNAQKGYSNYKLGNVYFESDDLSNALSSFEKADKFFNSSKENVSLNRNQQFSSWIDRNSIALSKLKNILKK